eukprot:6098778-Pleurochrysis_carterae.AAC.1
MHASIASVPSYLRLPNMLRAIKYSYPPEPTSRNCESAWQLQRSVVVGRHRAWLFICQPSRYGIE